MLTMPANFPERCDIDDSSQLPSCRLMALAKRSTRPRPVVPNDGQDKRDGRSIHGVLSSDGVELQSDQPESIAPRFSPDGSTIERCLL